MVEVAVINFRSKPCIKAWCIGLVYATMNALLSATIFASNSYVITTSGHCLTSMIFGRKIRTSRNPLQVPGLYKQLRQLNRGGSLNLLKGWGVPFGFLFLSLFRVPHLPFSLTGRPP